MPPQDEVMADRPSNRNRGDLIGVLQPTVDPGVTEGLTEAVSLLLPALEEFLQYEDEDRAAIDIQHWRTDLDETLPETGVGAEATLRLLADAVVPHGGRIGAPGFAGWITTAPTTVPAVAGFAASLAGPQRWWVQAFNHLEYVALEWLKQLLGLPVYSQGVFNSGGAAANLLALGAARQWSYEKAGLDPSGDGVGGLPSPRIYASDQVHHVVHRAAGVLGLGRRAVVAVPSDDAGRLDPIALGVEIRKDRRDGATPVAVIATAGTVNTGAVDPLRPILEVCREEGVWMHVDGAYGGFGVLDPGVASLFDGMADADSVAVDPHKWMAVPLGCGATFVRDRDVFGRAFTLEPAEYLEGSARPSEQVTSQFQELGHQLHDFTIEQSARSRGVTVWALLKEIGAGGMRERVRTHNLFARRLAAHVEASPRLELLAPVSLSICCFRYLAEGMTPDDPRNNELNRELLNRLHAEHHHTPSSTELGGRFAIRACYINPRTIEADVDGLAAAVERIGNELVSEGSAQAKDHMRITE